jgi:MFS family permease
MLGFGLVVPILPFYATHFGADGKALGLLMAIYSIMQFIFAPVWGRLSDRVGRKPVLLNCRVFVSGSKQRKRPAHAQVFLFGERNRRRLLHRSNVKVKQNEIAS